MTSTSARERESIVAASSSSSSGVCFELFAPTEWEGLQARVAPLGEREIRAAIAEVGGLVGLTDADRAALYQAICIQLRYEKERSTGRELVHARSTLRSGGGRI